MRFRKLSFFMLAAVFFCTSIYSQTQPADRGTERDNKADADKKPDSEKDKKKKELEDRVQRMIDGAVADAAILRLPDNRAVVYGISGDLYWKFDEKKARELFR